MSIPKVDPEKCTACEECVNTCPVEAIKIVDNAAKIDPNICSECHACVSVCPVEAISAD